MDLISRQAAIDAVKGRFSMPVDNLIVEVIGALPSAEPEQRWIPVTERLPEEDYWTGKEIQYSAEVLVTIVDDDLHAFVDIACTVDGEWQLTLPLDLTPDIPKWYKVVAWMPLPEPYKGEEE